MTEYFIYYSKNSSDIFDYFTSGESAIQFARDQWERMTKYEKNKYKDFGAYSVELSETAEDILNNDDEDIVNAMFIRNRPEWKTLYKPE